MWEFLQTAEMLALGIPGLFLPEAEPEQGTVSPGQVGISTFSFRRCNARSRPSLSLREIIGITQLVGHPLQDGLADVIFVHTNVPLEDAQPECIEQLQSSLDGYFRGSRLCRLPKASSLLGQAGMSLHVLPQDELGKLGAALKVRSSKRLLLAVVH